VVCPRFPATGFPPIGLDTNVLVRYVAQDDSKQSPAATRLIESLTADAPGYVSVVSVVELVWVLTDCYALPKGGLCEVLGTLLRTKEIVVAHADTVWQAVRLFREGKADFADCLIERFANAAGCDHTTTFDRDAAKHCGMRLIG
jgi:predicted nucleic-acid-binding protein